MKPPRFSFLAPTTLDEVHQALAKYGDEAKLLAGGQSLGPLLNLRMATPRVLIDLRRVTELATGVEDHGDHLWVPAMTRHRELEMNTTAARVMPLLSQALPYVAHPTIRNQGTIGGSLAHSDSAAELPNVAVASDAIIIAESSRGRRRLAAADFFQGFYTTALQSDEVILGVEFPCVGPQSGTAWVEFAPRSGDYAIIGVAVWLELGDEEISAAKIVCSGVTDVPWRATAAESVLQGLPATAEQLTSAGETAAQQAEPAPDTSGSAEYKKDLVRTLTEKAVAEAVKNAKES